MSALRTIGALAASVLLVLLTTGTADAGNPPVRPGTADGAELVKTGWWWQGNETPLDGTVAAPPQPSPPNVPKGALPVAAAAGEPEKYSAIEFRLAGKPGAYVESAVLVLRENTSPGATANAEGAKVLACPVTESFWADGAAAAWKARPAYDCDLASSPGLRDPKTGLWTFDLTAIASLWTAEGHQGSTSVALVEGAEAPEAFQVSFDGPALEGVGFAFSVGKAPTLAPLSGAGLPSSSGAAGPFAPSSGAGSGSLLSGASAPVTGTAEVAPVADVAADPAVAAPGTAQTAPMAAPTAAPVAVPAWYSGIPTGGYLLLPLVLGLAYLLMLALGPDAQPASGPDRHGVARALERLRTTGPGMTQKGKS